MEASIGQAKAISNKKDFIPCIERYHDAYTTLANDGERIIKKVFENNEYTLQGINTSISAEKILEHVKTLKQHLILAKQRVNSQKYLNAGIGNILFYGVSGGGKSELCKYLAKFLEIPCRLIRVNELISKFVGETEKNIARVFDEAQREDALLVLDEVDSFIPDRNIGGHSWEITMTNEFLTSLETNKGICICTTNRKNALDSAVMRRFGLKVEFMYAKPEQLITLYQNILTTLVDTEPPQEILDELRMQNHLCTGDFQNVKNQFYLYDKSCLTHKMLLEALKVEKSMKQENKSEKIGFTG